MKKLVAFDVDGTFLDSFGVFKSLAEEYSRDNGLSIPCFDSISHGYHAPEKHDFKWGMELTDQKTHLENVWRKCAEHELSNDPNHLPELFNGAKESFIALKDMGYTLAIITAKPKAPLMRLIDHHKIENMFCTIRTYDDVENGRGALKPAPDLLQCAMRELGYAPEETVMIGDTSMDIEMGLNAKASTIGVTWGSHKKEVLINAGAHHIANTEFADIIPIINNIFK